uniref:Uncharacterized protein n=1 Tax=Leersia perrieri TaxID=77586 RepID=A0A0D9XJ99_9ORYZ
ASKKHEKDKTQRERDFAPASGGFRGDFAPASGGSRGDFAPASVAVLSGGGKGRGGQIQFTASLLRRARECTSSPEGISSCGYQSTLVQINGLAPTISYRDE